MSQKDFEIYLDELRENRYRHRHARERGAIVEFRIQYEALIAGQWQCVVRYDSVHGQPHRDVLHPDGSETKEWYGGYANAEVLTIGQRDIIKNWRQYRLAYEREMEQ
jgi:hypothetical protein